MIKQLLVFGFLVTTCTLASGQSILSGKVTDAVNHEPLPFANVVLYKNGVQKFGSQSDYDGLYRLVAMEAGIYNLEISLIGYQKTHRLQVHLIEGQSITLDVELKEDSFRMMYPILIGKIPIVRISNTAIIMGRVTMNGERLPYVNVVLLQSGVPVAREITDIDGLYRIIDVNSGTYDIEFSQVGYPKTRLSNVKVFDDQCFTAHAELKMAEDSSFDIGFGSEHLFKVKAFDSLQVLKPLDLPKPLKIFGCGVTSGGHSPLFYISSCQMQVNPADTMVYAVTPMPMQSLQITNAQGQEMFFRTHLPAGTQKINVHNWEKGVYNALFKEGEFVFKTTFSIIR